MVPSSWHLRCLRLCVAAAVLALSASAQPPAQSPALHSRILQSVDENVRVSLAGTTPRAISTGRDLGALQNAHSLQRMLLVLRPGADQQASLQRLIEDQHNAASDSYHQWLTPEQFASQFGPSDDDLAAVKQWLQSHGLVPTAVSRARQWIEFSGTPLQVNSAFATSLHRFELNGRTHIANTSDISIPQALTPVISGVLSLNDIRSQPAHSKVVQMKRDSQGKAVPVHPDFTSTDGNGNYFFNLAPADFQTIYNENTLLKNGINGKGISIAIAGRSNISLADVQAFRHIFGLPQNDPNIVINGTSPGFPNNGEDQVESTLDVEWAGAAAPGATINLVESASTDTTDGIDLSSTYIVDNASSPILSVSYGECEALMGPAENEFHNRLWEQAAAEGITVFVSTGDGGAAQCDSNLQELSLEPQGPALHGPSINGLASTPFNIAVGGTQFNEAGHYASYWAPNNTALSESALGYIPEQVWNESCDPSLPATATNCPYGQTNFNLEGSGGGPSNCSYSSVDNQGNVTCIAGYPKPSWQSGLGVPKDAVRDTPDLSLNASPADDGYLFCVDAICATQVLNGQTVLEQWASVGGTSVSAPSMAGIMALVEQKNGAFQGQADYTFYKLAAKDNASSCNSSIMSPGASSSCIFNDITTGNNSDPGLPGYDTSKAEWSAGVGYDLATGLGTVNAANLAANWKDISLSGSATTLAVSQTTLEHGQPVNLQIDVASAGSGTSIPTGIVALATDRHGDMGSVSLDPSGTFSGPVRNLPGGTYNLYARYAGNAAFTASASNHVSMTVTPEQSKIAFNFDVYDPVKNKILPYTGIAQYAFPFFINVTVAGKSGQGLPTGMVDILNDGKVVATAPLSSSGVAYITTGDQGPYIFPVGASSVSIRYSGDNSFASSTSAAQDVVFQKQKVTTGVGVSAYDVPAGQPVFFTPSIPPGFGKTIPTGTFQFYDNGKPLGEPMPILNDGRSYANLTYIARLTTVGMHSISVGYSGDVNYSAVSGTDPNLAGVSQFMVVPVSGAATVTTIVQTPTTVSFGQSFNYIVTVTPLKKGGPVPTGQVSISSNNNIFGTITLINGQGSVTEQGSAGTSQVFAQYQGDPNYAASTSPVITTRVSRYNTPVSLTAGSAYVPVGEQVTLNMVASGFSYGQYGYLNPTGTVQFFTAVDGAAPRAITSSILLLGLQPQINAGASVRVSLPEGKNVVTARYSGDASFDPKVTAPVTIEVGKRGSE